MADWATMHLANARRWREKAASVRAAAEQMPSPDKQAGYRLLAASYIDMATAAESHVSEMTRKLRGHPPLI